MIISLANLKKYLPVTTATSLAVTDEHQTAAWNEHFPKFIGPTLMASISGSTPPSDLLAKVEAPLAYFTLYKSIPFLDLVLTGSGFGIVSNDNIAPASADRVKALAVASLAAANNAMDELLFFLQDPECTYHDDWNKSSIIRDGVLRHAADFQLYHDINESPTRFFAMRNAMVRYQAKRIVPLVGALQLTDMLRKRTDTLVLPNLQRSMAHYGLSLEDPTQIETADHFISMAIRTMIDNPTLYPLYHAQMYEAFHANNEDDYPVFG